MQGRHACSASPESFRGTKAACAPPGTVYLYAMQTIVTVLLALAMLGTLGILFAGMVGLAQGKDGARSNTLMRWRVWLQGIALALFVILLLMTRG
jgi:hypothetical protein